MTLPDHLATGSYLKSNFYEQLTEHVFISELLQEAWFKFGEIVEVLRTEVDSGGYDLVLECRGAIRHVQLKTSGAGAKTSRQNLNTALEEKPSGCVIWIVRDQDSHSCRVRLKYLFFGGRPNEPLPSLGSFKVARHSKGNAQGVKNERPAIRSVPKKHFERVADVAELFLRLFGSRAEER